MGTVADRPRFTLSREGRFGARQPLSRLLGSLGILKATGLLQLKRCKLVRRVILSEGRIDALVSNAREDRLVDWLLGQDDIRADQGRRLAEIGERAPEAPLTAQLIVATRLFDAEELAKRMREHLGAMLEDCLGWNEGEYTIQPGRVNLGNEPPAMWPALEAALRLARAHVKGATRRVKVPGHVVSTAGEEALSGVTLGDAERLVLAQCLESTPGKSAVANAVGVDPREAGEALEVLFEAGLLVGGSAPKAAGSAAQTSAGADEGPLTLELLEGWLQAAESEDYAALLGLAPGTTDEQEVRRAYYRTVRRFHPDRFREGEFAPYFKQVEQAFRLVHEAETMITDPHARARKERERQGPARQDPARAARARLARAREAAAAGRRQDALEQLERAVEQQPNDPDVRVRHAALLITNPSRRNEALQMFKKLANEQSTRADMVAAYALALRRAGKQKESETVLGQARGFDPGNLLVRVADGDEAAIKKLREDPLLAQLVA